MTRFRALSTLAEVPAAQWDALQGDDHPFLAHAFLAGLEQTGCLRQDWGWTPHHATLWDGDALVAAAPGYLKDNSHGEFVFDHAWAEAYQRYGRRYYPKWLIAVPYSPVPGPRLLAHSPQARSDLAARMLAHAKVSGLSSLHLNFLDKADVAALDAQPAQPQWLAREDVQYHWHNPGHWRTFDDFLADLTHKKRKNIRAERRQVAQSGVTLRRVEGPDVGARECAAMYRFYLRTFVDKGNSPALTADFFAHLVRAMPAHVLLVLAEHDGEALAGALFLRSRNRLYGRYWGADVEVAGLHFEACYYQGIEYCLQHGIAAFEPGAQGEHKIARGFAPVTTHSRHWIADPDFARVLAPWCAQEREAIRRYRAQVSNHLPFRHVDPPAPPLR